jgi:geranylgeranyl pyrophosphate synthase
MEYWLENKEAAPEEKIKNILEIYDELNVCSEAGKAIDRYFEQAEKELAAVALADERKEEFRNFACRLINRKK